MTYSHEAEVKKDASISAAINGGARKRLVLFADGVSTMVPVYVYQGAALVNQPTAYTYRSGRLTWLVPGQSVEFVEAFPVN